MFILNESYLVSCKRQPNLEFIIVVMVRLKKKKANDRAIKHTFCLRLTRVLPAASFRKRRSCRVKSLLLTWKMRVPLMSDTLKSFSPRVHSFVETASSTGYCARYCGFKQGNRPIYFQNN
jgi:hypothetical protein